MRDTFTYVCEDIYNLTGKANSMGNASWGI